MESDSKQLRGGANVRRKLSLAVLLLALSAWVFSGAFAARGSATATLETIADLSSTVAEPQGGRGATFDHGTPGHAARNCASCHERRDNSPAPRVPGHKACTDCHLQQFVTADSPLCVLCHTSLSGPNPPVKAFSQRLLSFNVRFDHAQHGQGAARPEAGCASCHAPARGGFALTIPAGLRAHENCYQCHTPQARSGGRDMGSCGACHSPGRYSPTPTSSRAFRVNFKHADHGPRQRLDCASCHTVRAGLPQGRQVTSPVPVQHFGSARAQSCMTCHDNRRAFGGDDFSDCKRCHTGPTFRF